jgi:hypothetical protein
MVTTEYKSQAGSSSGGKAEDHRLVHCHNCSKLGHFKHECRSPVKETALVAAKEGDDGVHLLMMETCELMEEKPASAQGAESQNR